VDTSTQARMIRRLTQYARRISLEEVVKEAELAEQRMTRAQSEPEGLVKVTAVPAFAMRHLVPALAEWTPRRLDDLRQHECVVFPPTAPKGVWTFQRRGRKHSVDIRGALETDEMEAVRAAVLSGMGIGILPLYMTSDALRQGRLVPLLRDHEVASDRARLSSLTAPIRMIGAYGCIRYA
jgi:DNA-binding transcriptional LysR family regulator